MDNGVLNNKKILLIIHGLVRPNLNEVNNVKNLITDYFKSKSFDVDTLLSTWINRKEVDQDDNFYPLEIKKIKELFDFYLVEDQPEYRDLFKFFRFINGLSHDVKSHASNVCGVYHVYKKLITISKLFDGYDYFIFCRSDINIELQNFSLQETDSWVIPQCFWIDYGMNENNYNDHFFIAESSEFKRVFQNLTIEKINNIIEMPGVDNPEKIYKNLLSETRVRIIDNSNIKRYYLNRDYKSETINWVQRSIDAVLGN